MTSKTPKDENFPVAFILMPAPIRKLVANYYTVARTADDIADNPALSEKEKSAKLDELEQGNHPAAAKLREDFRERSLSPALVADLFTAFRKDARNDRYNTWAELIDYCSYSAAPVGRFMLAAFNENPAAQLPSNSLCAALQLINHIQDIKSDATVLNRIYLPQELMAKYGVAENDLRADASSPALKALIGELLGNIRNLLKDAGTMPGLIASPPLRMDVFIILSLADTLIKKIEKGDVLARRIKLSRLDWFKPVIAGGLRTITKKRLTT